MKDLERELFATGNYIVIHFSHNIWSKTDPLPNHPIVIKSNSKLIHKNHEKILNAWLLDNDVEIELKLYGNNGWKIEDNFILDYLDSNNYQLKGD